jgi:Uma2 family endonuclease
MSRKLLFYDRFGVDEYYLYDPDRNESTGWLRREGFLDLIEPMANWVSPQLQIRFDISGDELQIYRPDGQRFLSYIEIAQRVEQERQRAVAAEQRAEQAEQRAQRLAERLWELGIDPEQG